jgi:hypothetical protein
MSSILGIYKLPGIKHVFFIVSSLSEFFANIKMSKGSVVKTIDFEHIHLSKNHIKPIRSQQWSVKVVSEHNFLNSLKQYIPTDKVSSNQSSHIPVDLELLTINQLKTPVSSPEMTFHTPKVLSVVPDSDIIEVFI